MTPQIHHIKLPFATVEFYDTYVVCKINQGISLGIEQVTKLHETYRDYFGNRKYGYIFDRTTDYTVDPISYMQCPYYPDVTAFAIVAPNEVTKQTIKFEQKFSKMTLVTFDMLQEAQDWMENHNRELGVVA